MGGQQANLPVVIVWLQALAVPVLGLLAAWIAYQQWRTADRKVQLDLFDRRFAVYDDARSAVGPVVRKGAADIDDFFAFGNAIDKAPFLFGEEVVKQFDETRRDINQLGMFTSMMSNGPPYDQAAIEGRSKYMSRVSKFYTLMPPIIEPYMDLSHKSGRTRAIWVRPWRSQKRM